ncbi:hypothetical protein BJY04DRAFT_212278 [Aspergillus karnatakaensis]|uniref:uncharacterized protein n=1 Tax=Aspergillus karnatakaensis TaxID=1810916 RepID=UPI003CCDCBFB
MSVYRIEPGVFLAVLWVCIGLQCLFLSTRFTLRLKFDRRWLAEDALVLFAWLLSLASTLLCTVVSDQLYLSIALSQGGVTNIPANIEWATVRFLRSQLAGYYLAYFCLWSIKMSVSDNTSEHCASQHTMWYSRVSLRVATSLDIITDAAIIVLSGNSLWRARITGRRKLALVGISLLTAFIIIIIIIIALVRMLVGQTVSGQQDAGWVIVWHAVEILVAIVVACLASIWTLRTKW